MVVDAVVGVAIELVSVERGIDWHVAKARCLSAAESAIAVHEVVLFPAWSTHRFTLAPIS